MPKGKQAHKAGSFQVGKSKLLKVASGGGRQAPPPPSQAHAKPAAASAKHRNDAHKQIAALRERASAKNYKKPPAPKVVLAAPIFALPTKHELLMRPLEHPMDLLLLEEKEKEVRKVKAPAKKHQLGPSQAFTLQPPLLSLASAQQDDDDDL